MIKCQEEICLIPQIKTTPLFTQVLFQVQSVSFVLASFSAAVFFSLLNCQGRNCTCGVCPLFQYLVQPFHEWSLSSGGVRMFARHAGWRGGFGKVEQRPLALIGGTERKQWKLVNCIVSCRWCQRCEFIFQIA